MTQSADMFSEADAFDARIAERLEAGFVPDLRRAAKCEYFYKSFWRDPHFIRLYLGRLVDRFLDVLRAHAPTDATIIDVGCGAGYISLELARHGYRVTGVDISKACIDSARRTAVDNPFRESFGSLAYEVGPLDAVQGKFDVVLCSGVLHHMPDVGAAVAHIERLLPPSGLIIASEPQHERWRRIDAAQVFLMRSLLSIAGLWYEPEFGADAACNAEAARASVEAIYCEYREERDPHEAGQSPNDNSANGEQIRAALESRFECLSCEPTVSYIYRMLGGLRGPERVIKQLAELLTTYDALGVEIGALEANGFLWVGRPD